MIIKKLQLIKRIWGLQWESALDELDGNIDEVIEFYESRDRFHMEFIPTKSSIEIIPMAGTITHTSVRPDFPIHPDDLD